MRRPEAGKNIAKGARTAYPDPLIVGPKRAHKQTLILLHGRGSCGEGFGPEFLRSHTTPIGQDLEPQTLADHFPNMKFIFPTAKKRRAKWYNRATINQWCDSVPIDEQDGHGMTKEEEEWQLDGLRESRAAIKAIIDEEVASVGAGNVFIGGLSQGCAMSLHVLLSYEASLGSPAPLGGFVGMSGWLPYAADIHDILSRQDPTMEGENSVEDEDDLFGAPSDGNDGQDDFFAHDDNQNRNGTQASDESLASRVCNFVRDNIDLQPLQAPEPLCLKTPVYLGHGRNDEKVKMVKGQKAAQCLRDVGMDVTWKDYDEGHWYKIPEEIDDIVAFLRGALQLGQDPESG